MNGLVPPAEAGTARSGYCGARPGLAVNQTGPQPWASRRLLLQLRTHGARCPFSLGRHGFDLRPHHGSSERVRVSSVNGPPGNDTAACPGPRVVYAMLVAVSAAGGRGLAVGRPPYRPAPPAGFTRLLTASPPAGCWLSLHCPRISRLL